MHPFSIASRVAASLLGGYAFTWGFTVLGGAALVAAGMTYPDAQMLVALLAFLVFLGALCWAHAARSIGRVWAVLAGGGALMTGTAWLVLRALH